jgi:hypothetical protein
MTFGVARYRCGAACDIVGVSGTPGDKFDPNSNRDVMKQTPSNPSLRTGGGPAAPGVTA